MSSNSIRKYFIAISAIAGSAALISLFKDIDDELAWYNACIISNAAEIDSLRYKLGN